MSKPRILFSHPIGNNFANRAVLALAEAKLLDEFHIAIAAFEGNLWHYLSKLPGLSEFERRRFPEILKAYAKLHPTSELMRLLLNRAGLKSFTKHETGFFSVDAVFRRMDQLFAQEIEKQKPDICYTYEDNSYYAFQSARKVNARCFYDLPIGYWRAARRIQTEEMNLLPDWAGTMPALIDSAEKCARKDKELSLADEIVVASSFTAKTLEEAPFPLPKPIVIPYGSPPVNADSVIRREASAREPLRVIFVGSIGQRKGVAYLAEAVRQLGNRVRLTLIGRPTGESATRDKVLTQNRWIETLPHAQVLEEMRSHDVLVFPSLFEGFGLVVTEALSQGLPVITTAHTCGPDILTDGKDGFIVPIRSSGAIAEKLELLDRDRDLLESMRTHALETAAANTWDRYKERLIEAVKHHAN